MSQFETMMLLTLKGLRVGNCVHTPNRGWRFLSGVSAHGNSRKFWPTAEACIPRWARQYGGQLITATEWGRRQHETSGAVGADEDMATHEDIYGAGFGLMPGGRQ